ncbi:hypothetical protein [Methyloglobulus sp.]|uniref:hypothetical protein n=1 Tax=Methyloglobulus sp. TaxID=2518622 RepID=UPI0032B71DD4
MSKNIKNIFVTMTLLASFWGVIANAMTDPVIYPACVSIAGKPSVLGSQAQKRFLAINNAFDAALSYSRNTLGLTDTSADGIIWGINSAKSEWLKWRGFLDNLDLRIINVALALGSPNIKIHEFLVIPVNRSTSMAYNFVHNNPNETLAKRWLTLRKKLQSIIYLSDKLAQDGAECSINPYFQTPLVVFNPIPPFVK